MLSLLQARKNQSAESVDLSGEEEYILCLYIFSFHKLSYLNFQIFSVLPFHSLNILVKEIQRNKTFLDYQNAKQ